jgi:hypothetical protein
VDDNLGAIQLPLHVVAGAAGIGDVGVDMDHAMRADPGAPIGAVVVGNGRSMPSSHGRMSIAASRRAASA